MTVSILIGDVRDRLRAMPAQSVHCVVTSPPYWGLRDYDVAGQIGLERTLGEHIDVMVDVFAEIWRVLRSDGTVWLNYGDCFATSPNGRPAVDVTGDDRTFRDKPFSTVGPIYDPAYAAKRGRFYGSELGIGHVGTRRIDHGGRVVAGGTLKNKDLCMVANRLAIALQDWGWYVRQEIVWHKPTAMPESTKDRPTTAHEKVWLLSKGEDYFYNFEAAKEPVTGKSKRRGPKSPGPNSRMSVDRVPLGRKGLGRKSAPPGSGVKANASFNAALTDLVETRNMRSVWTIASAPFREAHFATFPPKLAERCIRAGTPPSVCGACGAPSSCGGLCGQFEREPGHVLDPFGGAGTVGLVARQLGLRSTLIELNPDYAEIARLRIYGSEAA
ncbi:DNA-methyltransferase [Bosea sp. MMO-172]|uniref:DNA-methyltransferase n=1 Tax=Bosea sp. MMO-172 TaxID=3127885 RepID=UPI003015C15F